MSLDADAQQEKKQVVQSKMSLVSFHRSIFEFYEISAVIGHFQLLFLKQLHVLSSCSSCLQIKCSLNISTCLKPKTQTTNRKFCKNQNVNVLGGLLENWNADKEQSVNKCGAQQEVELIKAHKDRRFRKQNRKLIQLKPLKSASTFLKLSFQT